MKNIIKRIQLEDTNKILTDLDYEDIETQCFHSSIIVGQFLKEYGNEEAIKKYTQESLYEEYNKNINKAQNLIDQANKNGGKDEGEEKSSVAVLGQNPEEQHSQ